LGHDFPKLLVVVPKAVLLLVVALAVVVSVTIIVLVGGVRLLRLGVVGDDVSSVATLKAVPR
jgi:hypothetical protein